MRVAIVVQRYGVEVVGGAESLARAIAEQMTHSLQWEVEVFTSCALDYRSWRNYYPVTTTFVEGVKVHRFATMFCRSNTVFAIYSRLFRLWLLLFGKLKFLNTLTQMLEHGWFMLQGPYCPSLVASLSKQAKNFDRIFFYTYLYYPTVCSILACSEKAVLIPTAHDEAPLYFPLVRKIFASVRCFLASTQSERDLILPLIPNGEKFIRLAGVGIEMPLPKIVAPAEKPFLLYLGRIGRGKGLDLLLDHFQRYCESEGSKFDLVLAGEKDKGFHIKPNSNLRYLGFVSEEDKTTLIAQATILVNPSPLDSLSLLVLEGLAAKKPVLLNGTNPILQDYCSELTTVIGFSDFAGFRKALNWLEGELNQPSFAQELERSRQFVVDRYSWDKVLNVYKECL